jgi:hypothetical protein
VAERGRIRVALLASGIWARKRGTVTDVFARQLTRPAAQGLLVFDDPVQAAQHLTALTLNQLNARSLSGIQCDLKCEILCPV